MTKTLLRYSILLPVLTFTVNIPPRTIDTMDKAAFPSFEAGSQPPFYNTIPAPSPAKLDVGLSRVLTTI